MTRIRKPEEKSIEPLSYYLGWRFLNIFWVPLCVSFTHPPTSFISVAYAEGRLATLEREYRHVA